MKRDRHGIFLFRASLLSAGLLMACAPRAAYFEPIADRAKPTWVLFKPELPDAFSGVGFAPRTLDPDQDRTVAISRAREDLLSGLQADYPGYVAEQGFVFGTLPAIAWDEFAVLLGNISPKDTYVDKEARRVWAYVSLPRKEFDATMTKRRRAFEAKGRRYLQTAMGRHAAGQVHGALIASVQAFRWVAGPEGMLMAGASAGVPLRLEIESFLRELLADLEVSKVEGPDRCRASGLQDVYLGIEVAWRSVNQPGAGIPVRFEFRRGAGRMGEVGATDAQGRLRVSLLALDPRVSPAVIEAGPDFRELISRARLGPLPDEVIESLEIPHARFEIVLEPPRLLLTNIERGGTGGGRGAHIIRELAEALREQGLVVQDADVDLLVNPEVFRKVEAGQDPGDVAGADMVAVVAISLERVRKERGQYQDILYGEGVALFRLYDLQQDVLLMDVRMEPEVSGFSQGDVERNFFLQAIDELRSTVTDALAEKPFLATYE